MKSKQHGLSNQVKMWPTPDASMSRGVQKEWSPIRKSGQHATYTLNQAVSDSIGNPTGQLNPQFVEWLMGVPIGFTDSKCSETAKSLLARMLLE